MANMKELSNAARRIFDHIRTNGQGSRKAILAATGMEESEFSAGVSELQESGMVVPYRCQGGGLRFPVTIVEPAVDASALEAEKERQARSDEAVRNEGQKAERDLYPYVQKWADRAEYKPVVITGDFHRRPTWENPDLIALRTYPLKWLIGSEVEVAAIEVKLLFDAPAIWQAAHYRRFAHYVYLACYESMEALRTKGEGRLFDLAVELGIGILCLSPGGQGGTGVKCQEVHSPIRQNPQRAELDSLLTDYGEKLELEKPGQSIARQLNDLSKE